jgi:hypothetical protein
MKFDITILIVIIPFLIGVFCMYKVMKFANVFFRRCDNVEFLIKNSDESDTYIREKAFNEILELSKQSFHKQTGNRLRELANMFENKYNINITN